MPNLNKPSAGDTDWAGEINDNWTALENQLRNAFQARLQMDSYTQVSLQRFQGDVVEVNGKNVSLGASGLALLTSDNLITSTGADSGSAMSIYTLYYLYVSNSDASPFPSSLRASLTSPSTLNGVKYLGTTGNQANWRFVGWVRTNSATQFVDSPSQRTVVNYYNRRMLSLASVQESADSWTYTTDSWRRANDNASNRLEVITNGEDAIFVQVHAQGKNSGSNWFGIGVGVDSTGVDSSNIRSATPSSADSSLASVLSQVLAEGFHQLNWIERSVAAGTTTWYGDHGQPTYQQCGLVGWMMG